MSIDQPLSQLVEPTDIVVSRAEATADRDAAPEEPRSPRARSWAAAHGGCSAGAGPAC